MQESIARQMLSVSRQPPPLSSGEFFSTTSLGPPTLTLENRCRIIGQPESEAMTKAAARRQRIDPALLRAVIQQESGFRSCAVSAKGAMGLMQLMPDTVARYHVTDPFDPDQNIRAGARYLKDLITRFEGNWTLALAAYNAGPARVEANAFEVPAITETENYVRRILENLTPTDDSEPER